MNLITNYVYIVIVSKYPKHIASISYFTHRNNRILAVIAFYEDKLLNHKNHEMNRNASLAFYFWRHCGNELDIGEHNLVFIYPAFLSILTTLPIIEEVGSFNEAHRDKLHWTFCSYLQIDVLYSYIFLSQQNWGFESIISYRYNCTYFALQYANLPYSLILTFLFQMWKSLISQTPLYFLKCHIFRVENSTSI